MDIQKTLLDQNDGILKGLGAVAEVLEKMDARLSKQEEKDEEEEKARLEEEEEMQKAVAKQALVKEILSELKAEFEGLMDLEADKPALVRSKTKWPMGANPAGEDDEVPAKPRHLTHEVQKPIQAMKKHDVVDDEVLDEDVVVDDEVLDEEDVVEKMPPVEEGAEEYPMEEDDNHEMPYMKALLAEIKSLRKEVAAGTVLRKSLPELVEKETEKRLAKMGFQQERSMKPKKVSLPSGTREQDEIIKKSWDTPSAVRELAKMSYRDLTNLKVKMRVGPFSGMDLEGFENQDWSSYGDEE